MQAKQIGLWTVTFLGEGVFLPHRISASLASLPSVSHDTVACRSALLVREGCGAPGEWSVTVGNENCSDSTDDARSRQQVPSAPFLYSSVCDFPNKNLQGERVSLAHITSPCSSSPRLLQDTLPDPEALCWLLPQRGTCRANATPASKAPPQQHLVISLSRKATQSSQPPLLLSASHNLDYLFCIKTLIVYLFISILVF